MLFLLLTYRVTFTDLNGSHYDKERLCMLGNPIEMTFVSAWGKFAFGIKLIKKDLLYVYAFLWPAESIVQAAALFKFQTEVAFFFQGAVIFIGPVREKWTLFHWSSETS